MLDATGTSAELGKTAGRDDAALHKSTYVRLLGVEGARAEAARLARGSGRTAGSKGSAAAAESLRGPGGVYCYEKKLTEERGSPRSRCQASEHPRDLLTPDSRLRDSLIPDLPIADSRLPTPENMVNPHVPALRHLRSRRSQAPEPRRAAGARRGGARRLIECCSVTGGHIGASLGVVELAIALLYEFDSPPTRSSGTWDTRPIAWKLLTGRNDRLPHPPPDRRDLRLPQADESEHDQFGAGHAGTAMSAALGMATARDLQGEHYKVVGGGGRRRPDLRALVRGDEQRRPFRPRHHPDRQRQRDVASRPTSGAISKTLGRIVANPATNRVREGIKGVTRALGGVFGDGVVEFAKNVEESAKNLFSPGMLFEELGFRYFGPIDGHDLDKLIDTLRFVKPMSGPPGHPRA